LVKDEMKATRFHSVNLHKLSKPIYAHSFTFVRVSMSKTNQPASSLGQRDRAKNLVIAEELQK